MSIATQITRIADAVDGIKDAITAKGVAIPAGSKVDALAGLVESISTGVDTSGDTVTAGMLAAGLTAHDSSGNQIVGTMPDGDEVEY